MRKNCLTKINLFVIVLTFVFGAFTIFSAKNVETLYTLCYNYTIIVSFSRKRGNINARKEMGVS